MDNTIYEEPESEINLVEAFWKLLSQWKAILIVAIVAAIALPGVKLLKDLKSYNAQVSATEEAAVASSDSDTQEGVDATLAELSSADRKVVERLVKQQEAADQLERYLNESLLYNTNPNNQRTLVLKYYLQANDAASLQPLTDAYTSFLINSASVNTLGEAIDANAEPMVIRDLLETEVGLVPDSYTSGALFTVYLALPAETNLDAAQNALVSIMDSAQPQLSESVGDHSATLMSSEEIWRYNTIAADKRVAIISNINNLRNMVKANVATLTDTQKQAFESISRMTQAQASEASDASTSDSTSASDALDIEKPSFSVKYALLGFAGGIFMYVVIYLVVTAVRGGIESSDELRPFARSRTLGEIRYRARHKGIQKLFHSKMVERIRYRNLEDINTQIQSVATTTMVTCNHAQATSLTMLAMVDNDSMATKVVQVLISTLQGSNIGVKGINVSNGFEETELLSMENAILIVQQGKKASDVWKKAELCDEYDVKVLGNIFVGEM